MTSGWIKLHRKIKEWEWYKDSQVVHLFYHLIVSANDRDKKWKYFNIRRGEFVTSVRNISEETGIPVISVRRKLEILEKSGAILRKTTNKFTLITICKYDSYQSTEQTNEQTNEQTSWQASEQATERIEKRSERPTCQASEQTNEQTNEQQLKKKEEYILLSSSTAYARTHEESFIGELLKEEIWIEQMCMKHKISKVDLEAWLNEFQLDAECRGKKHDNISDAKQHFNDWLRIQLKIKNDADDRKESKIQRRGFERAVSKAEDYTHTF